MKPKTKPDDSHDVSISLLILIEARCRLSIVNSGKCRQIFLIAAWLVFIFYGWMLTMKIATMNDCDTSVA